MRSAVVDAWKAAAICGVLMVHAGPIVWPDPGRPRDLRLTVIAYAVPLFFVVAGYAIGLRPTWPFPDLARRLVRLLAPYAVATVVWHALGWSPRGFVEDLLTGRTLEIYYFVPLYCLTLVLAWPLLQGPRGLVAAAAAVLAFALWRAPFTRDLLGEMRNPVGQGTLLCLLAGWAAARAPRVPPMLVGGVGAAVALAAAMAPVSGLQRVTYTLGVAGVVAAGARPSRPVRWLADATLAIFLYHLPFVEAATTYVGRLPTQLRVLVLWTTGLLGSLLVVVVGRRVLGKHAKLLLGA